MNEKEEKDNEATEVWDAWMDVAYFIVKGACVYVRGEAGSGSCLACV